MDIKLEDLRIEKDIVKILQNKVDSLKYKHWEDDFCQPDFTISLLYDNNIRDKELRQYIILTCDHLDSCVSAVVFPIDKNYYGYDSMLSAMNSLYKQTM